MSKAFRNYCWRAGLLCVEGFAIVAILLSLLAGVVVWRLKTGPVDVGFAIEYIQEALKGGESGNYTVLQDAKLHWPDLDGPLLLGLKGVQLKSPDGNDIVSIDEVALSLSKSQLLLGRVAPTAIILRQPQLRVIRSADGFDFGFGEQAAQASSAEVAELDDQETFVARVLEFIARPGQEEDTPLSTLKAFQIKDARLSVEDHVMDMTWFLPNFDAVFKSAPDGLEANINLPLPDNRMGTSSAQTNLVIDWDTKAVQSQVNLKNFDTQIIGRKVPALDILSEQDLIADFVFEFGLDSSLQLENLAVKLNSQSGSLAVPRVYAQPIPYEGLAVQARYNAQTGHINISDARITVKDVTIKTIAALQYSPEKITGSLTAVIDELAQDQISPLWPTVLRGDNSERWVVHKMSEGAFSDVNTTLNFSAFKTPDGFDFDMEEAQLAFAFSGMSIDYRSPLMPVTDASGVGAFNLSEERLSVDVTTGKLGDVDIPKADLRFTDIIKVGQGQADITVDLDGPFATILDYVSREPIGVKHGFDQKAVKGNAKATVNVKFPTVQDIRVEDVRVNVEGRISDVFLPDLVRTMDLSGGPLAITVNNEAFTAKGRARIDGHPVTLDYYEYLNARGKPFRNRTKAQLTLTDALRDKMGVDLSDFMTGPAQADVEYTKVDGVNARAQVQLDLKDSKVFVDPFDYVKNPGLDGQADMELIFHDGDLKELQNLTVSGPELKVEPTRLVFREGKDGTELSQGRISRFVLGETVAGLELEMTPSGQMKLAMDGAFLDLRPFLRSSQGGGDQSEGVQSYGNPPLIVSAAVDAMRTADDHTVQYAKIYADIDGQGRFNQLEMDAIAGQGDIYLRYKPDDQGMRVFRFEADDAGAALKAFDLYDQIQGGKLVIYGEPIRGIYDRNLLGVVEIRDFKVVNAPSLARLLSAMSLPGFVSLLNNEGISFSKMEAKFDWLYRSRGSVVVLKDGRTSGNSLGLTFDGVFDNAQGTIDVSGTIVPLSGVNKFIGSIPVLGDFLTGGTGSLFAATYKMEGPAEEPETAVNPLSVLAPGILRRILFE